MREKLLQFAAEKKVIGVNFNAAAGGKLISASGTITEVGADFMVMMDIYNNAMIIPFQSIAYLEVKR
jgi:hypothetical protein